VNHASILQQSNFPLGWGGGGKGSSENYILPPQIFFSHFPISSILMGEKKNLG